MLTIVIPPGGRYSIPVNRDGVALHSHFNRDAITCVVISSGRELRTTEQILSDRLAGVGYVLNVFQKKSKSGIKTPKAEIALVKARLKRAEEHHPEWLKEQRGSGGLGCIKSWLKKSGANGQRQHLCGPRAVESGGTFRKSGSRVAHRRGDAPAAPYSSRDGRTVGHRLAKGIAAA
jgi:hypothetical protein